MPQTPMPLHEHLRRHARERPDKPAYVWYGATLSFAELDSASDAFAARLAEIGVGKGDPVALFVGNCPQYVMAHVGIQKLGAVACPCSPLFKEHELAYQLGDLRARVVVAADALLPIVEKVRQDSALEHVFAIDLGELLPDRPSLDVPAELLEQRARKTPRPPGVEDFLAVARSGKPCPAVAIDLDDVALMVYTSGTTGLPKGAMLSYDNALYKTAAAAECSDVRGDDVLMAIAPLYHIAGMVMGVNLPIYSGATAVLMYRFDPRAALQAIDRYKVSWWYSIAPMNVAMMNLPEARQLDLSSLRVNAVTSFGITYTEELAARWRGFAKNAASFEAAYGLTETHTVDTYMPADAIRWGKHGKPVPGNEIRILDPETGAERASGETGEIVLRSRGAFKGYWNKPEATAKTLRDGWVHTGDMGTIDAEGYLTFIGRFKEMIKVSGYSVFPEEVETMLVRHPAVAQAAVIGVPDPEKGEVVKAFIVRKPGAQLDEPGLIAWSREQMASYKAPRAVRFVDALPATGAGKVLRRLLRDLD
jgi:long-chain acyl-CoA synthetase